MEERLRDERAQPLLQVFLGVVRLPFTGVQGGRDSLTQYLRGRDSLTPGSKRVVIP